MTESNERHSISCKNIQGLFARHTEINDIIARALRSVDIPAKMEPPRLLRDDEKRPDGMSLIPWEKGQCLVWDGTCVNTFAKSYLKQISQRSRAAADQAVTRKHNLYEKIKKQSYIFVDIAVETVGPRSVEANRKFVCNWQKISGDPRSRNFLFQKISLPIQKNNTASIIGGITEGKNMNDIFYL